MTEQRGPNSWVVIGMLAATLSAMPAHPDVSDQGISYQGRLILNGSPVTGTADVEFRLFDVENGGTALETITKTSLAPSKGLFSTALEFDPAWFDGGDLWLELAVRSPAGSGSYVTVSPRQAVRATGYSHYSTDGGGWEQVGNVSTFTPFDPRVGIGVLSPVSTVHAAANKPDVSITLENKAQNGRRFDFTVTADGSLYPAASLRIWDGSAGANRVVIAPSGNIGIGTVTPSTTLDVARVDPTPASSATFWNLTYGGGLILENNISAANAVTGINLVGGNNNNSIAAIGMVQEVPNSLGGLAFYTGGAGLGNSVPERMRIKSDGNVGLGTNSPTERLEVAGNVKATNVMVPSDARLKRDVTTLSNALAVVSQLRGVSYRWKDSGEAHGRDDRVHLGFIAQEIGAVLPEVVKQGGDGYYTVSYMEIVPVLAEAIHELGAENDLRMAEVRRLTAAAAANRERCEALERTIADLMGRLEALEGQRAGATD